jgi:hypothetical protein
MRSGESEMPIRQGLGGQESQQPILDDKAQNKCKNGTLLKLPMCPEELRLCSSEDCGG